MFIPIALASRNDFYSQGPFYASLFRALSVSGDLTCCNACQPSLTSTIPKSTIGDGFLVTCGRDPGTALIDFYLVYTDNTQRPWYEAVNPSNTGPIINRPDIQAIKYECYFCNIPGTPVAGLTPCSSNSDCQSFGSNYICDGGFCHQNCDAVQSGSCVNGRQRWLRASGCSDNEFYTPCAGNPNTNTPPPDNPGNPISGLLGGITKIFTGGTGTTAQGTNNLFPLILLFGVIFLILLIIKFTRRK